MPTDRFVDATDYEGPGTLKIGIADGQVVYVQIQNDMNEMTVAVSRKDFEDLLERAGFVFAKGRIDVV